MNRLRGELKGLLGRTIRCPDCGQMAFVVVPDGGTCHFCSESWPFGRLLVHDYLHAYVAPEATPSLCPDCGEDTLAQGVAFADSPEVDDVSLCFTCSARYASRDLFSCLNCSRPWPMADVEDSSAGLCPDCHGPIKEGSA